MTDIAKKSFWGKGIWLAYGLFVVFILGIASFAAYQHFDLVESDYYEHGLKYQQQIDKTRLAIQQQKQPTITYSFDPLQISICFPNTDSPMTVTGTVLFFRPSAAGYDINQEIKLDEHGCQTILDKRLMTGYWRVKVDWIEAKQSYYYEQQLFVEKSGK